MNDINFDELDKAVSSVLQDETSDSTQSASPVIAEEKSTEETSRRPDSFPKSTAVTPNRRRGQFMDMVHPSSRMSSPKSEAEPTALPSRKASKLRPLNPAVVENSPEEITPETIVNSPVQTKPIEDTTETFTEPAKVDSPASDFEGISHSQWPDPIDFVAQENMEHSTAETTEVETQDQLTSEGATQPEPSADLESSPEQEATTNEQVSLTSPFIEGTEVEKRPLGSFAVVPGQESSTSDETNPTDSESSSKPEENISTPVELESEIVSVESDSHVASDEHQPLGFDGGHAQGIPAQYQIKPTEPDVDEHAVFDTENYHQPLAPAEKKHGHTWLYILLFGFMLLLGAGIVYVLFILGFF